MQGTVSARLFNVELAVEQLSGQAQHDARDAGGSRICLADSAENRQSRASDMADTNTPDDRRTLDASELERPARTLKDKGDHQC
jgi:hypothetical protein